MSLRLPGICRKCERAQKIIARGLCNYCYSRPHIRHQYDGPISGTRKEWTDAERKQLRDMRREGVPAKICAKRLGRTMNQIHNACRYHRYIVRDRDRSSKTKRFKELYDGKRSDVQISHIMGCSDATVHRIRKKLGFPVVPQVHGGKRKQPMRCMSCDATGAQSRAKIDGWAVRQIPGFARAYKEVYCPKCFEKWGWPELSLCPAQLSSV